MCGIAGIISLENQLIADLEHKLSVMSKLIAHRGPDGQGVWANENETAGFAHRRLSIIDLSEAGAQPMVSDRGTVVCHNGEIYNYQEIRKELQGSWSFSSNTDTECLLALYNKEGEQMLNRLRGMFAFSLWDEKKNALFCARDRFGIKPFYYAVVNKILYFASEAKALLPFLPSIETDEEALAEYLTFQYTLGEKTLFKGIYSLPPAHMLTVKNGNIKTAKYWDVKYEVNMDYSEKYFIRQFRHLFEESIGYHLRSDVPVGSYLSGGIDSSLVAIFASRFSKENSSCFHGKFTDYPGYDESPFAKEVAESNNKKLFEITINHNDFRENIRQVIYSLDFPIAGPGSFPQFMVSKLAAERVKVVLGGQGGDEIFGGYARYLLAYFEQCIKAALDGTYKNGNFIVTIESIIPNLGLLREYKPLIKQFWKEGLFEELDSRYFRLIDRSSDMEGEVDWGSLNKEAVYHSFQNIFNNAANVRKEAYFDKMTHFDFKCLLPALLHVEDRMSMAHGLESRVPFLDHPLIELIATVPADIKFEGGQMKHMIKQAFSKELPSSLLQRRDKMGFPVPLKEWFENELNDLVTDVFQHARLAKRPFLNTDVILKNLGKSSQFSRKTWGLLSLEIWHQEFHDKADYYRSLLNK